VLLLSVVRTASKSTCNRYVQRAMVREVRMAATAATHTLAMVVLRDTAMGRSAVHAIQMGRDVIAVLKTKTKPSGTLRPMDRQLFASMLHCGKTMQVE